MSERNQYESEQNSTNGSHERPVFFKPKIVITGGPCAGKTTVLNNLQESLGQKYLFVPEAATIVLGGGFPKPPSQQVQEWQRALQIAIIGVQKGLEYEAGQRLDKTGSSKLGTLLDRGLGDNAAYLPGGIAEYESLAQEDINTTYQRYSAVIHLGTLAHRGLYQKLNNTARFEDEAQALQIDKRLRQVWQGHKAHYQIDALQDRTAQVQEILNTLNTGEV
jgi:predicted ATPase